MVPWLLLWLPLYEDAENVNCVCLEGGGEGQRGGGSRGKGNGRREGTLVNKTSKLSELVKYFKQLLVIFFYKTTQPFSSLLYII